MRLPESLRDRLKSPFGTLFSNMEKAVEYMGKKRCSRIISVGDVVTATILEKGIRPDVAVVDYKTMRAAAGERLKRAIEAFNVPTHRVTNPAATISEELWKAFDLPPPIKIVVDGEEDLATLVAIAKSPLGSCVIYGQPRRGVVVVEITQEKKQEVEEILKQFE